MEHLLEELTEPTEKADLKIILTRDGVGIASKAKTARVALLVTNLLAIVALPVLLLIVQVQYKLPSSEFFFADSLGTVCLVVIALMAMFGHKAQRGSLKI